ncbi:MAG: LolA family protein [Burkholderiales bacterium]
MAALSSAYPDPIASAIERYRAVEAYEVTLKSSHGDEVEHIRYYFRKPGFVRMEFIRPHKGAVLVYNPTTRKARLWPFGPGFMALTLSPDSRLIQSPLGQRVDRSDVAALLENVKALQEHGKMEIVGEEPVAELQALHFTVSGTDGFTVGSVHRYDLWLEASTLFPVKVVSRDIRNQLIETVLMEDAKINPPLQDSLFNP